MNIRAKLISSFLSVSLISLAVSSSILYFHEKESVIREVFNHLESVASIQRSRIQGLYAQNLERLRLVASRTQLRISLNSFKQTGERQHQDKMNRIIADAKKSIDDFKSILIVALDGKVVAATNGDQMNKEISIDPIFLSGKRENRVDFFHLDSEGTLVAQFSGPLYLNEQLIGVLIIKSSIDTMMSSISDYTGLGKSGETMLASRSENGSAIFIMPTRFDKNAALKLKIDSNQADMPMIRAVNGDEMLFERSVDYRGKEVLSVTRYIDNAHWGLTVKIDRQEVFLHLTKMRNTVIIVFLIFAVFIVFISLYFAKKITSPIIQLTNAAKQIINGNLLIKADEASHDEIGLLGQTFNIMTASLHDEKNKLEKSKEQLANSEAKFRGVLESAVDGVCMIDELGKISLANPAICELTGYSMTELIGEDIERLIPDVFGKNKGQRASYFKNPSTRRIGSGLVLIACRKNATHFPVEVSLTPVVTDYGTVVAVMIQDVTLRLEIAQEKEELLKSLGEKNVELERFTYTVSHDLKGPLVTISGFIGLLEKDLASGHQDRISSDFKRISDAAITMQNLLDDLLELSRIGRQITTRVNVSVNEIVNTVLQLLAAKIEASQAKITIEPGLPMINVELARFQEVYLNLIENSIKYQRDGVLPEIVIGVRRHRNETVFFVKDNGTGIDPRYHQSIFNLFERLSVDSEGTGVGLAIVKRIMEVHDGRVWVESAGVGHGSTFNFVISQVTSQYTEVEEIKINQSTSSTSVY